MEGAPEVQICVEYQIYCLFYCFGSSLKFKSCCRIWRQIQMGKSKVDRKASSCEVKTTAHRFFIYLYSHVVRVILKLCNHMLF